jgi:hypothetical protein
MANSSRGHTFYSLGVMPVLMGLGHLAPAIGAIHTATGSYQYPGALLGMIGTAAALVDCRLNKNIIMDSPDTDSAPLSLRYVQRCPMLKSAAKMDMEALDIFHVGGGFYLHVL